MKTLRILLAAALFAALFVLATPAAAQCTADDPDCPIEPPISQQVGTDSGTGDGRVGEGGQVGGLVPIEAVIPVAVPDFVEPEPFSTTPSSAISSTPPNFETLPLSMRYQDPSDVSCGVQALGMALDGLGGGPTSNSILAFLQSRGMMYDFGTGVEELAYAAHAFGYEGSLPFHDWTLEDLLSELAAGRPVVVSLGSNGEDQPGHFATLTGISPDGKWVATNDPILGRQVLPVGEFLRVWELQGHSGVAVAPEPIAAPAGVNYTPFVALAAGLMALISQTPLVMNRKGIGGRIEELAGLGDSTSAPPYPPPPGYKWERKVVAKYGYKDVPVTTYEVVPNMVRESYETTRVWYERVPRYRTITVDEGRWAYRKVTKRKRERYVRYYKTKRIKKKKYYYRRGRRYSYYSYSYKRYPVYGYRYKTYTAWERYWKPKWVTKRIPDGTKLERREETVTKWRTVQRGTKRVPVTTYERARVKVGTEVKWELKRIPEREEPPQPPEDEDLHDPKPTSTPSTNLYSDQEKAWLLWNKYLMPEDREAILEQYRQQYEELQSEIDRITAEPPAFVSSTDRWLPPEEQQEVLKDWERWVEKVQSAAEIPYWLKHGQVPPDWLGGANTSTIEKGDLSALLLNDYYASEPPREKTWDIIASISGMEVEELILEIAGLEVADYAEYERVSAGPVQEWSRTSLSVRDGPGGNRVGYLSYGDIIRWTGRVREADGLEWHEIEFKDGTAWVAGKYLESWVPVSPAHDPAVDGSTPPANFWDTDIRFPQDTRIYDQNGTWPQYITLDKDILSILKEYGYNRYSPSHNLCGFFDLAVALRVNVNDLLLTGLQNLDKNEAEDLARILGKDETATRGELQPLLDAFGREYEDHDGWLSPAELESQLEMGRQFVALTGVDSLNTGQLVEGGSGHWILVTDVEPAANSGWVRVYNSLTNKEEVLTFEAFNDTWGTAARGNSSTYHGFWIEPSSDE